MSVLIRRITLAVVVASLAGGMLALPAASKTGPVAKASKCRKGKKGKHHKKKCKGSNGAQATLPGQATHSTPTPPVVPPALLVNSLAVTDNPVLAGSSTQGRVMISGAAPSGGQSVVLQSSDPARAAVPGSVVVAPGQTTATFQVDTTAGSATTATLTASIGGSTASRPLDLVSTPSVSAVALDHQCYPGPGSFTANSVTLDVAAPTNTAVTLSSDDPLALSVSTPVTVAAGSNTAFFPVTALLPTPAVTVTATLSPSQASDTASIRSLASPPPAASGLDLNPSTVNPGGTPIGTVTLDCEAPPGGTVVTLGSTDSTNVSVPATVTAQAGQLSADFPITVNGRPDSGSATISATAGGVTKTAELIVEGQPI